MKGSSDTAPAFAGAVAGTGANEFDTKVSATVRRAGAGG
jgi:hypothetical protein